MIRRRVRLVADSITTGSCAGMVCVRSLTPCACLRCRLNRRLHRSGLHVRDRCRVNYIDSNTDPRKSGNEIAVRFILECRVMIHTSKQRRNSMAQQSSDGGRPKLSEKGLLTPDNCVVALIDHQPQMLFGVSNFDRQGIINSVIALAKASRVFELPAVLSTVETKSFSGNMWPQLRAVFPGQEPIERSSMNSWDDKNFVAAIEKTGRKKIVLAGLWTETCVA